MPDTTDPFEHLQILQKVRDELIAAAHRHEASPRAAAGVRSWLSHRVNAESWRWCLCYRAVRSRWLRQAC